MTQSPRTTDVMSKKIWSLPMGSNLQEALDLMQEHRIRHLPVVAPEGSIVGVLTFRDFSYLRDLPNVPVESLMSVPVEWVDQELSLRSAALRMIEKKISCLIVANTQGEASGIVTSEDLLWVLAELLEKEDQRRSPKTLFDVLVLSEIANQISQTGI